MKLWSIHAAWAVATILSAAVWGRCCTPTDPGPEVRPRRTFSEAAPPNQNAPEAPNEIPASTTSSSATLPAAAPDGLPDYEYERLTVEQIRSLLKSDVHKDWWRALRAMDKLTDRELKKELYLLSVGLEDENIRYSALMTLASLMGKDSLPLVQKALISDPSDWVRGTAAIQLGKLGGEGTVEVLLKAAHDKDLYVRVNVAAALSHLDQPGAVSDLLPVLTRDLDSPDDAVRREAVENLAALKSAQVIPYLIRSLKDGNGAVKQQASIGLSRLEVPEVVPAIEALKKDPAMVDTAKDILETYRNWNDRKK